MPNVDFHLPEIRAYMPMYQLINDCVAGSIAVKGKGVKYLPKPAPADLSKENGLRYDQYRERAVFYNVTRRTLGGLVGQMFDQEPIIKLPEALKVLETDATGTGIGIVGLAKGLARSVVSKGRGGLFVDYPDAAEATTLQELEENGVRPTINYYKPEQIINWRVEARGAEEVTTLVVLKEPYVIKDDGFEQVKRTQWRVLKLTGLRGTDGQLTGKSAYSCEIWRDNRTAPWKTFNPTDAAGNPLNDIPFKFVGAENNDPDIDEPPMFDLADLNVAHYRNSADYEETCYVVGQPTLVLAGLTAEWYKDVLGGRVDFGSRGGVPLPVGATAELLQVQENTMAFEGMGHKERQMVALGAKLVEQKQVQRTATEAGIDANNETSTLVSSAENVSAAMTWAIEVAGQYAGTTGGEFTLNTEYELNTLSPGEQKEVIATWQAGAISWTEMRTRLRHGGLATQDDKTAKKEIDEEMEAQATADAETLATQTDETIRAAEAAAVAKAANTPTP